MADEKEKPQKTPEELDKQIQEENRKKAEKNKKFVDETVGKLQDEAGKDGDWQSGQERLKEIGQKLQRTQVVAAGAEYGPNPIHLEKLKAQEFPLVAPPLPDGTPVANIAQVETKETSEPKSGVGEKKPATSTAAVK